MFDTEGQRDRALQNRQPLSMEEVKGLFDTNPTRLTPLQTAESLQRQLQEVTGFLNAHGIPLGADEKIGPAEISKHRTAAL